MSLTPFNDTKLNTRFFTRVQECEGYDANQVKIALFSPEVKIVSIAEIFNGAINRKVGTIRDREPVVIRFKVIVRIIGNNTTSAPSLFFNNNFVKLSGYTAWELIEKHNIDPNEYWPEELDSIAGKKGLFKIFNLDYNVTNNNHTYRCDAFTDDAELINHFKKSFLNMDSEDEEFKDVLVKSTTTTTKSEQKDNMGKHLNIHDSKDEESNYALVMSTNTKIKYKKHDNSATMNKHLNTHETSTNEEGLSSRKTKLIIDLDEVEARQKKKALILLIMSLCK
ncbi:hypothetical protein Tco_1286056 [Tanacetum coccineum]